MNAYKTRINKKNFFFFSLLIVFIIYHLVTLSISPLVWFDESWFNGITLDLIKNGTFFQPYTSLFQNGSQHLYYGPVFFILNGLVLHLFGNDPFQGRLLGLLAGFGILTIITHHYKFELKKYHCLFVIILAAFFLDPFFNASLHKGRNDTLALVLYILSFFTLLKPKKNEKILFWYAISGLLFSLSLLTTMRMMVFFIPFLIYFLFIFLKSIKRRKDIFYGVLSWGLVVFIIYSLWIYYAFGSYFSYYSYFLFLKTISPVHLGGFLFVPTEEYFLVFCLFLTLSLGLLFYRTFFLKPQVRTIYF